MDKKESLAWAKGFKYGRDMGFAEGFLYRCDEELKVAKYITKTIFKAKIHAEKKLKQYTKRKGGDVFENN